MASLDTPTQLTFERSFYIGGYFTAILYGIQLCMFFLTTYFVLYRPSTKGSNSFYLVYSAALLFLWTIALACNAIFGEYMWIDHRDAIPGGPAAYMYANLASWYNTLGTTAGVGLNFLGDALLIYRCYIIWASNWIVVVFPILIYFAAMSMSILLIWSSAQPDANFFQGRSVSFGVPYVSLTISLNIIVTLLICGRLVAVRNRVRAALGEEHARTYTNVVSIIVESAAPFTVLGIAYVVSYARNSPTSFAFVQVWGDFCALSPQLIILRVVMGQGWNKDTAARVTSGLVFNDGEKEVGTKSSSVNDTGINIGLSQISDGAADSLVTPTSTKNAQSLA